MSVSRSPTVCACGDHAFAALTKGFVTLVSPEDARLLGRPWYALTRAHDGHVYAARNGGKNDAVRVPLLHREILGVSGDFQGDHVEGNGLDNRRGNLRTATHSQNLCNRVAAKRAASKYLGVARYRAKRWRASIQHDRKAQHLGYFYTEEAAARAYDKAAVELHGAFARPNFPTPERLAA